MGIQESNDLNIKYLNTDKIKTKIIKQILNTYYSHIFNSYYNKCIINSLYKQTIVDYILYPNKNIIIITLKNNRKFDIPLSIFSILSY